ncbi:hypothetical protein AXF42_Ash013327 [Apostasia shenzhenica]|uniref:BRO1 domain-containing protein n=1 Tax=Apostasia shenzhenica TaxID=1088818 RepID=A0A2I0BBN3_9ASPA|nr:hypothetical protein AXF42_Ash013327 [Apostasia shenzhenica]
MGCFVSTPKDTDEFQTTHGKIGEFAVYVPGLRIPKIVDLSEPLGDRLPKGLLERLSALRTRVVGMTAQEVSTKPRQRMANQHDGFVDLLHALEDYLRVLLGLAKEGCELKNKVQFVWTNQEDAAEETGMPNVWYEILSVLHLMAMLCLTEANLLLIPKTSADGSQPRVPEENRRSAIDILLKAAGYLDCAVQNVLPQFHLEERKGLPIDLAEGTIRSLCMQALAQINIAVNPMQQGTSGSPHSPDSVKFCCYPISDFIVHVVFNTGFTCNFFVSFSSTNGVDIQLGLAIDCPKATLAVKRRLACEMVKCCYQAHDYITKLPSGNGCGEKHRLFVKWKYNEAKLCFYKAAAYYYHGLILDEGNNEKSHGMAVAALQAAEECLKESKEANEAFNSTPPVSRSPPLWGSMKLLSEKIPKDASSKVRINRDLYSHEKIMQTAPSLPEFMLALKPDEYQLPPLDSSWKEEEGNQ